MWKRLRRAPKPHLLANVISPLHASLALLAWQSHLQSHLIPDFEPRDTRPDCGNYAGRFMAKRHGLVHENVTIAVVVVVMEVRATETGGADIDLEFIR